MADRLVGKTLARESWKSSDLEGLPSIQAAIVDSNDFSKK
jgi:hypothetical protein